MKPGQRLVRYRKGQETAGPVTGALSDDDEDLVTRPVKGTARADAQVLRKGKDQSGIASAAAVMPAAIVLKKGNATGVGDAGKKPLVTDGDVKKLEEDAAEAAARRRAMARAKLQEKQDSSDEEVPHQVSLPGRARHRSDKDMSSGEEAAAAVKDEESSSSSSASSSDSSSSSDEDDYRPVPLLRPTFVSKSERTTVVTQEQLEREEMEAEQRRQAEEKERVEKSKTLLRQTVAEAQRAAQAAKFSLQQELPPETIDDGDETEEFEKWKVRELQRMKRDHDERREWEELKVEVERRRQMSDAEILAEDADKQRKEKAKLSFLQRYYHKGAFYQDELAERYDDNAFTAPTGQDADIGDKSVLPSVMQVRSKWGLKGRSKYTHLTDQDTTFQQPGRDFGYHGGRIDDSDIKRVIESKRAGMKPLPEHGQSKKSKH